MSPSAALRKQFCQEAPRYRLTASSGEKSMMSPQIKAPQRCCLLIFVSLVALTELSSVAQAPPSSDTFVSSATPKINYGPSITLVVGQGTTSYIQFNLSGIPANAAVSKARTYLINILRSDLSETGGAQGISASTRWQAAGN
jgi:hypothetical protein